MPDRQVGTLLDFVTFDSISLKEGRFCPCLRNIEIESNYVSSNQPCPRGA